MSRNRFHRASSAPVGILGGTSCPQALCTFNPHSRHTGAYLWQPSPSVSSRGTDRLQTLLGCEHRTILRSYLCSLCSSPLALSFSPKTQQKQQINKPEYVCVGLWRLWGSCCVCEENPGISAGSAQQQSWAFCSSAENPILLPSPESSPGITATITHPTGPFRLLSFKGTDKASACSSGLKNSRLFLLQDKGTPNDNMILTALANTFLGTWYPFRALHKRLNPALPFAGAALMLSSHLASLIHNEKSTNSVVKMGKIPAQPGFTLLSVQTKFKRIIFPYEYMLN